MDTVTPKPKQNKSVKYIDSSWVQHFLSVVDVFLWQMCMSELFGSHKHIYDLCKLSHFTEFHQAEKRWNNNKHVFSEESNTDKPFWVMSCAVAMI